MSGSQPVLYRAMTNHSNAPLGSGAVSDVPDVESKRDVEAPEVIHTSYVSAPTSLQENVTGEVTGVAPSPGVNRLGGIVEHATDVLTIVVAEA